jgi:peptidoglycan/LPS O-acetylase OafA/YrhL
MNKYASMQNQILNNRRLTVIDLTRLISVLLIISYHFYCSGISITGYSRQAGHWIIKLFSNSYYGVTFFFVVSGFIITRILADSGDDFSKVNLMDFYVKRAARILPLLGLTVGVAVVLMTLDPANNSRNIYCFKAPGTPFGWDFWLSLATFQFNWFILKADVAHPIPFHWEILWTLAVEEQFYFFYPLIVKNLKTNTRILIFLLGTILFGIVYRAWAHSRFPGNVFWGYFCSFANFDQIAVGCVLFFVFRKLKNKKNLSLWISLLFMGFGIFSVLYVYFYTSPIFSDRIWQQTLISVGCASIILGSLLLRSFNSIFCHFISWPGKFSYGCYVWQAITMFLFWNELVRIGHFGALALYLFGTWSIACFSYFSFEIPMNKLIRKLFNIPLSKTL